MMRPLPATPAPARDLPPSGAELRPGPAGKEVERSSSFEQHLRSARARAEARAHHDDAPTTDAATAHARQRPARPARGSADDDITSPADRRDVSQPATGTAALPVATGTVGRTQAGAEPEQGTLGAGPGTLAAGDQVSVAAVGQPTAAASAQPSGGQPAPGLSTVGATVAQPASARPTTADRAHGLDLAEGVEPHGGARPDALATASTTTAASAASSTSTTTTSTAGIAGSTALPVAGTGGADQGTLRPTPAAATADPAAGPTTPGGVSAAAGSPAGSTGAAVQGSEKAPDHRVVDPQTSSPSSNVPPGQPPSALPDGVGSSPVVSVGSPHTPDVLVGAATVPGTAGAPVTTTAPGPPVDDAPPAVPLPLPDQLVRGLSPLLRGPDGTHRLTLHLDPEHLGSLRVQLSLSGSEVSVQLIATDHGTREVLRHHVDGLRAQLEELGLRSTGIDVATGGGPAPRDHDAPGRSRPEPLPAAGSRDGSPSPRPLPGTTTPTTALDLRM